MMINGNGKRPIIIDKKALIPIGLVGLLIWGGYWVGMIRADVNQNAEKVDNITEEVRGIPTRYEFDELKQDVKEIANYIRNNK